MKSRSGNGVGATVFAALTIIGCCLSSIGCCQKQRTVQRRQLEDAVQNWEGEGGAILAREEEHEPAAGAP